MVDILPDSRLKKEVIGKPGPMGLLWVPIFCANCGCDGGLVPEENMNFAFYLCPPCFEKHGTIAGTYAVPEEIFWDTVNAEQMEKYGRLLPPHELQEVVDSGLTPLSALFNDKP